MQVIAAYLQDPRRFPYIVVVVPPGYGKLLGDETPMLTSDGWRTHGDLEPGDRVFAPDGTLVRVLATKRWPDAERLRVVFDDGATIIADAHHEWDVLCDRERYRYDGTVNGKRMRSTKRIAERLETRLLLEGQRRPPAIPLAMPLAFPERNLPIDPYVLGLWLGNGSTRNGLITFNRRDVDHYRWLGTPRDRTSKGAVGITPPGLVLNLRAADLLSNKHIPVEYQIAGVSQRLRLLQGLMDTDGDVHAISGQCTFSTSSETLRDDARRLILSLGFKATVCESRAMLDGVDYGPTWRILFMSDSSLPCCTVPFKRERLKERVIDRTRRRFIVAVEPAGVHSGQCIQVEGGRYLAGDALIATHNSTLGSVAYPAWKFGNTHGRTRIGLISNTATQAHGFSRAVQQTCEGDEYRRTFPDVMPDLTRVWAANQFYFTATPQGPNPGLLAMGMDGPALGKRFDEIIIDDPSTWAQVRSEQVMTEQRNKIMNTIIQRFPAGSRPPHGDRKTRAIVLMTRFGERDLLSLFRDDLAFTCVHMPAMGYWDRIVRCSSCGQSAQGKDPCDHDPRNFEVEFGDAALWPERESRETLLKMRESDELIFELVYQGNVSVLAGNVFSDAWFQRGPLPGSFDRVIMGIDTAGGKDRKHGDYTAITTIGLRGDQIWIIDSWRDRLPAPEQELKIVEKFTQWQDCGWTPELVVIEDVGEGTAVFQHLSRTHRLPLKPVKPTADKEFRSIALSNAYRARRVWHPEGERWTRAYEAELLAFPEGAHDDLLDSAVHAYNESAGDAGVRLRAL